MLRPGYSVYWCILVVGFAVTGCTKKNPSFCESDEDCPTRGAPFCDLAGDFGDANTCAALPVDAGQPGVDAARVDAAGAQLDGGAPDASLPLAPPLSNGQPADLVLGQPDFVSSTPNNGGESRTSLAFCTGLFARAETLWVSDGANARVLQWNSLPIFDRAPADIVLGQTSFSSHVQGPTQTLLTRDPFDFNTRNDVHSDGTRVLVADRESNRVLIWTSLAVMNAGEPADLVLGQTSFTGATPGLGPSGLDEPEGVWTDGTRVIVADTGNSRVLIWNNFPTVSGAPADVVLGQTDFGSGGSLNPPTPSSIGVPVAVEYEGGRLFVVDSSSAGNRVMVWNALPTENGTPADVFVGQPNGNVGNRNAGSAEPNAIGLDFPTDVAIAGGSLFVTDTSNHRVVVYTPIPTSSGEAAAAVVGQAGFVDNDAAVTATGLTNPRGLAVAGGKLFVCDALSSRVLQYTLAP